MIQIMKFVLGFIFLSLLTQAQSCNDTHAGFIKNVASFIPEDYNPLMPPPTEGGEPTKVTFSVVIMNVRDVHETTQDVSLEMNIRIHWVDSRLKNLTNNTECLILNPNTIENKIWRPDIFVDHVKSIGSPPLMSKPASLRLFENGALRFSERVNIVVSCHMDFQYYPADIQRVNVDLKSYAYTTKTLILAWDDGESASFKEGLNLPNFDLDLERPGTFQTISSSGVYSGIRFIIGLRRRLSYHLLQTYLPSTLFIIVSWLTFIIPQDGGALPLSMTLLLTTTAMFGSVRSSTPNVSYAKAIDIWMVVCMIFIFMSLVQHALTIRLRHMKKASKAKKSQPCVENPDSKPATVSILKKLDFAHNQSGDSIEDDPNVLGVAYRINGKDSLQMRNMKNASDGTDVAQGNDINKRYSKEPPNVPAPPVPEDPEDKKIQELKILGNKIRRLFSLCTPICFLIFNIIYWSWLLRSSGYNQ